MLADYRPFMDRMIPRYEGGYCWDKGDPGGPTNYGITCYDLAESRGQRMTSMSAWASPVRNMTLAEAEAIYVKKYAVGLHFNELPAGPDVAMMDYGVNSGIARPIHVARALVGLPPGVMDNQLLDRILKSDPQLFVDQMCAERLRFMHSLKGGAMWQRFGHGWGARVADLKVYGDHLALGHNMATAAAAPDLSQIVTPKAIHTPNTAGGPTSIATVGAGVAAQQAGFHWMAVGGIMAATVAAGVIYEIYQEQAAKAANATVHV